MALRSVWSTGTRNRRRARSPLPGPEKAGRREASRAVRKGRERPMPHGRLEVVGTGFQLARQITVEALDCIRAADKFFFVADGVTEIWLRQLHPDSESLATSYAVGRDRDDTYEEMVERMLAPVRGGARVCAAL